MKRLALFSIIAVVTLGWAIFQRSPSLAQICFWGLVVVGVLIEVFFQGVVKQRRSVAVTKFLEEGDVDRFLEEIEKDIEKEKLKAYKNMLLINKTAGLYYKGRPREALALLDQVDPRKLPAIFS